LILKQKTKQDLKILEVSVIGPLMADILASAPKKPYQLISSFQLSLLSRRTPRYFRSSLVEMLWLCIITLN